jgi:predicted ATPase/class 3 adenylate cyclase
MVMEPTGESISERLTRLGSAPLPLDEVLTIAIDVAKILGSLHEVDIVHKNVVPKSIVADPASGYRLTGLALASELASERQGTTLSRLLEGSLPYISPEQTGRTNRGVDYRSDLYSLGVTCFEMLTGALPFSADHAGEWVYCHICKAPPSPSDLNPDVPATVSAIVLKLLAKNAEDRYQSAYGLTRDLERCRDQLRATGIVVDFPLGEYDISRRFQLPQQLFGRERELSQLFGVFELVAAGSVELCLVTGQSGVGKTALVNELGKVLVREDGYLLQGKFDQFQSNAAYSAVGAAFRGLVAQLLTEPPEQLERWRSAIIEALGLNAALLIDVVPELVEIIGPQPPVPDLPPTEAFNRFQILFTRFVRVFATSHHPLVIFLDDLQWSDAPTLELIRLLVTSRELRHLLLIGAYRSAEVDVGHRLLLTLNELRGEREVEEVVLEPLERSATRALVAETLCCEVIDAAPLADLLHDTAQGNPFFINEMLRTLHYDGLIAFSPESGTWTWDVEQVRRTMVSDDVAEFMAASLRRLPEPTQEALQLAACIGNSFELRTLSVIAERSVDDLADALLVALRRTMVVPLDDEYRLVGSATATAHDDAHRDEAHAINAGYAFNHDRVQQAAYELIDDSSKQVVHLRIGRLMQDDADAETLDERLIDVVGHLNYGRALIDTEAERRSLADLNLRAGIRAKRSSAYQSALDYLAIGKELLAPDAWSNDYALAMALTAEYQQCAYLLNRSEEAEEGIELLLRHARTKLERAEVLAVRTRQYSTLGRMVDSIQAAIAGLALLDIRFPENPTRTDIDIEVRAVEVNLGTRTIEELLDAPRLTDPTALVAIRLLMEIFPAAFLSGSGDLFPFLVLKSVNLSLEHGTSPETAFAYATFGMLLCGALDDPALGFRYAKLAVAMNEMLDDIALKSRVVYVYAMFVHHWNEHWSTMTPWFRKGIEAGYESGDLLYLAYSAQDCIIWDPRLDLETASKHHRDYLAIVADCNFQDSLDSGTLFLQMQLNLLGETDGPTSLSNADFDERACLEGMLARKFMTGVANYHIYKAEVCLAHGDLAEALVHVRAQDELVASAMSLPQLVRFRIVSFLALARAYPSMDEKAQKETDGRFEDDLAQMERWAANCPENFRHLALTMEAERFRLAGEVERALVTYDRAIDAARVNGFLRDEATANELAARCLLAAGRRTAAEGYVTAAHALFGRWGARRKVALLEDEFPAIVGAERVRVPHRALAATSSRRALDASSLDVDSVIRASQAISGELFVDRLWATTLPLVLQNAGGQRGCVVVRRGDELVVETQVTLDAVDGSAPPFTVARGEGATLPMSVVDYVLRTNEPVVLNDLSQPTRFSRDSYLATSPPQSLLCLSMPRGGRFESAIYMEHRDASGIFTEDRIEIIRLLASQAMISLENAELYQGQVRLTEAQSRFVPRQFLVSLEQHDIANVGLGEHVAKEMSVLFADVRGFTTLAERLHPKDVIVLLNRYFECLEPSISSTGGFIDSFAGDGLMALFEVGADNAVDAGIGMCHALDRFNEEGTPRGQPELHVGIGVNTGPLLLGTVGAHGRLQCTVIGDTVNAASRIENLTRTYAARLLVGEQCVERLDDRNRFALRELDRVAVKGKTRAFDIYEVLDAEEPARRAQKEATRELLASVVSAYRSRRFAEARALAFEGRASSPDDPVFDLYARRSARFLTTPPPPAWAGVEDL